MGRPSTYQTGWSKWGCIRRFPLLPLCSFLLDKADTMLLGFLAPTFKLDLQALRFWASFSHESGFNAKKLGGYFKTF
ncbi:hypothetical protein DPMN_007449 [Dreissena polymorpha]|uniref:Uncharacterized protein n=1 Tax=Dreissena polymorpha TaxID=45954 RepID=A0A9D4MTA9_DREPO|nr:hypothetical protein DPMN_007449 [Dreissena polymorpha]